MVNDAEDSMGPTRVYCFSHVMDGNRNIHWEAFALVTNWHSSCIIYTKAAQAVIAVVYG